MNYIKTISYGLIISLITLLSSCGNSNQKTKDTKVNQQVVKEVSGAMKLVKYLEEMGDYVNSHRYPSIIKASSVYEELDGNIRIIDMRRPEVFKKGHIKNAVNVQFSDIPDYFENKIVPFKYDKIIMVCYGGQISSYTTSLLHLMGYGNVYSMRWGMSAWNKDFSKDFWDTAVSGKYEGKLEQTTNEKSVSGNLPALNSALGTGEEILNARIKKIFSDGIKDVFVTADQVFENHDKYYVMNYDRKDKYDAGHIPGAIRYKPHATLGNISEMETIPNDKDVVVYCGTGQSSGFATAYLRLLGYKAHTLEYGNNGFMYDKMKSERSTLSWLPFTDQEIMNYPYVKD